MSRLQIVLRQADPANPGVWLNLGTQRFPNWRQCRTWKEVRLCLTDALHEWDERFPPPLKLRIVLMVLEEHRQVACGPMWKTVLSERPMARV